MGVDVGSESEDKIMIPSREHFRTLAREKAVDYLGSDLDKFSGDLADAIADRLHAECQPQWLPIDTAPKDGTFVLLWCVDLWCVDIGGGNGRIAVGAWRDIYGGSWWDRGLEYTFNGPTHWMPLPLTPEREQS